MSWFYVKENFGTKNTSGGFASQQTGSFATLGAANVFDTIVRAVYDGDAGAGDFILVSHLSAFVSGIVEQSNPYLRGGEDIGEENLYILSVDDSAIDAELIGASYSSDSIDTHRPTFRKVVLRNFSLSFPKVLDELNLEQCLLVNCIVDGVQPRLLSTRLINTTISGLVGLSGLSQDDYPDTISSNLIGCSGDKVTDYIIDSVSPKSIKLKYSGCDLSNVTDYVISSSYLDSSSGSGPLQVDIIGCKLNATFDLLRSAPKGPMCYVLITNSGDDSESNEYQFHYSTHKGFVNDQNQSGIVRLDIVAARTFLSGETVSYKCETNTACTVFSPFTFELPSRFFELSNPLTSTIRVYFAVVDTVTLTDVNFWVEVIYSDETDKHEPKFISGQALDSLSSGTEHQTDLGSNWQDNGVALAGYNEYYLDIACPAGADGVPTIRINIGEPSVIVYVASQLDGVA